MEAILLGIIQGLTEFLPISSSAHLLLIPYFLGWQPLGLAFDVSLHIGTLLAVLIYFWSVWKKLIVGGLIRKQAREVTLVKYLIIGTIPAATVGYFGESIIEETLRHPLVAITTLILFGIILWIADRTGKKEKQVLDLSWKDILIIGICQSLALVPGVSRSGVTMTAGLGVGLTREEATQLSFLLLAPITFGAAITQLSAISDAGNPSLFIQGILASFVVGVLAIHFMLRFINRYGFKLYAWYRIAAGLFFLTLLLLR